MTREPTGRHRIPGPPLAFDSGLNELAIRIDGEMKRLVGELEARIEADMRARAKRTWATAVGLIGVALVPTLSGIYTSGAIVERLETTTAEVRALRATVAEHETDIAALRANVEMLWRERRPLP